MKRGLSAVLCVCVLTPVAAADPDKDNRLKEGAIVYAFEPVWWSLTPSQVDLFPLDEVECKGSICRYVIQACEPLYVLGQTKKFTSALPSDVKARSRIIAIASVTGLRAPTNISCSAQASFGAIFGDVAGVAKGDCRFRGGWSSEIPREWTLSRDECLVKIGKQPEPQPSPGPSPTPTLQQ